MSITCPQCAQAFSTLGDTPKFCSNCGAPLSPTVEQTQAFKGASGQTTGNPNQGQHDVTQAPSTLGLTEQGSSESAQGTADENSGRVGGDIGPFRLGRVLGSGGMGTVFEATDRECGQKVALKLLSRQLRSTPETVQRFHRESQIAASINHPRSTFVYQAGQQDDQIYITMELMNGGTLKDVVEKEGPLPVNRAVDYILDIISGLKVAHDAGVVHRDLKPSNCFVDDSGRAKVGDFGLSKSFISDSSLTQTGTFMGTPQYAAPEQLRASDVGAQADIYALGGTLFYLLTGRAPFVGNAAQVIASIASDAPPNVKTIEPLVPRRLAALINQTLEKDPEKRPVNLERIRLALRPFSSRGSVTADPGLRLAAFFIDIICASFVAALLIFPITFVFALLSTFALPAAGDYAQHISFMVQLFIMLAYFAVQEWKWGTTPGKWLLGLRVINEANETPTFVQSVIRTAMLPGMQQIVAIIPAFWLQQAETSGDSEKIISLVAISQIVALSAWLPNILCLIPARLRNGYRGFHELFSKTRVVRLSGSLETTRPRNIPYTVPTRADRDLTIDNYQVTGQLLSAGDDNSVDVFTGKDITLDRDVWIFATPKTGSVESQAQTNVAIRPTRQRTIVEKQDDANSYEITEAIYGMPLSEFVHTAPTTQWASFRPLIRELAYEFVKSEAEGSLPTKLCRDNIWIDQSGRLKLVSQAISKTEPGVTAATKSIEPEEPNASALTTPHEAIRGLLDDVIVQHGAPYHVVEFRNNIDVENRQPAMIDIAKTLGTFSDRPSAWTWIDKLGIISIFMAIEVSTLLSLGLIWALLAPSLASFTPLQISGLFAAFSVLTITVFSYFTNGGISLRVSDVAVCRYPSFEMASKLRCLVRSIVTWFLPILLLGLMVYITAAAILLQIHGSGSDLPASLGPENFIVPSILTLVTGLLLALTFVSSLFRPSRGLADLIVGTCLLRK